MPSNNSKRTLDNHLTLHGWLNNHFGYKTTRDLLNDVARLDEGFSPDGHSPICEFLRSRTEPNSAIEQTLPVYDSNIKRHLAAINNKRTQPIVLRYFQYLALLYTEIFLDWKFNSPGELLRQLNTFVQRRNDVRGPSDPIDTNFTDSDLEKLAFWMATGAGKTLIMHINYHQYLHYCKETLDHVVLITPNEGLSEQHIRELENSDIRCGRFNVEGNRLARTRNTMQVIEITKLVEEKTGGGLSVPVEAFEGNNLILVDEGHKGSGGNVWRAYREALAETGFTFEYSATFGQALAAAKNADLVDEYGKAIAFDYSYRYFYGDGYGKSFRILNVKNDEENQTETLLLANLLSFYEQRCYFKQNAEVARTYRLDSPLWAFVGGRVTAVYTEKKQSRSDVLNVIRFLHRFLINENWAIDTIEKILSGDSGLSDDGIDVFHNRLNYLRDLRKTPAQIYAGILDEVFHTNRSGTLHLQDVRNAQGEIALKTTHGRQNFGLIYIGDTAAFKKLVDNDNAGIETDAEDVLTASLFNDINTLDSPINILIGAKKFIEGWDSWRVTAMGLLNIGTQEGSQIIQLFGRGVRLRGKDMSLKRSSALDGEHPLNLPLLETLNIFAVRANFMAQFRTYLTREGVDLDDPVELEIPIVSNESFLERRLLVPKVQPYNETAQGQCVPLSVNVKAYITHITQVVEVMGSSSQEGIRGSRSAAALERKIPEESLTLVDWEKIYLHLLEYKQEKQFHNLIFDVGILKKIMDPKQDLYGLTVMAESEVKPTTLEEVDRLEELVITLLRKYIAKFYRIVQKQWSSERMELKTLKKNDENFTDYWSVCIPQDEAQDLKPKIQNLIDSGEIYGPNVPEIPLAYNNRHLYQPLLANNSWKTIPPALVESEKQFVEDLRSYVCQQREGLLSKKEVFLLRNQSRGRGVGFYQNEGFYPDFILWITEDAKQRIVFIEPHGMMYETINEHNDKITLFKRLRDLSFEPICGKNVQMDSFIISATAFRVLYHRERINKEEFAEEWHILFRDPDNLAYLSPIFQEPDHETSR